MLVVGGTPVSDPASSPGGTSVTDDAVVGGTPVSDPASTPSGTSLTDDAGRKRAVVLRPFGRNLERPWEAWARSWVGWDWMVACGVRLQRQNAEWPAGCCGW